MGKSAHIACAENISLLHLLHKIPEPPSVNAPPSITARFATYALSFATERALAGSLAFLSSITDSPDCITAVCIQEHRADDKLEVYVAINKKSPTVNNATLDAICNRFNQIFKRLSSPGQGHCENDVFANIVSLCRARILCRLGYEKKTMSKSTRTPLGTVLERTRESLLQLGSGIEVPKMARYRQNAPSLQGQISQFLIKSADVLRAISSWVQHRTDSELCAVINGLCDLVATNKWRDVIDLIPDRMMEPSSRNSLVTMLRKGARYRHIARILYRAAKKAPIVRGMRAIAIHLPKSFFQQPSPSSSPTSLESTFNRIVPNHKGGAARICLALKTTTAAFEAQTHKTLTQGKFHAEVQLLGHILTNPTPNPPRIVCASKDACFLCNCLLQHAHAAKLYTPRCHGRLYPGWRLPPTAAFRPLQASLNRLLEQRIQESALAVLQSDGRRRVLHPDPWESTCSTAMLSATTAATVAGAADAAGRGDMLVERDLDTTAVEKILTVSESSSSYKSTVSVACSSKNPVTEDILVPAQASSTLSNMVSVIRNPDARPAVDDIPTPPDTSSSSSSSKSTATLLRNEEARHATTSSRAKSAHGDDWTLRQCYALAQGEVVASSLPTDETSRMYMANDLRVQLEYTKTERLALSEETPRLQYRIQQLAPREAHTVRESGYIPIIDASSLKVAEERTYKLDEMADLYLSAGDCIFRLVLQPAIQPLQDGSQLSTHKANLSFLKFE